MVMDSQLVQLCHRSNSSTGLIALVETLRLEIAELRADVQRLHRENNELRQDAGYWRSRHRDTLQRIAEKW
jgi:FtsZ-binding cell division protein ZapB